MAAMPCPRAATSTEGPPPPAGGTPGVTDRRPVVLASANPKKAAELADLVGDRLDLVPRPPEVPEVVEDADTFVGNARLKAEALVRATGLAALADEPVEVTGVGFIRGKETDRIAAPVAELRRCGVDAAETDETETTDNDGEQE